ncbi:hypothetical protein [Luteimonas aquatica]|uniref:hypothetical protein n=1 Tax=Luteimonas aquatica TaxID=450364 RepID=UPI001F595707|nr:hypothetical protein [Luteimonas aquatica]
MDPKLTAALVGVVAGWLLAQLSTSLRTWHDRRRTRKALNDELLEISDELDRWWQSYARTLQISTLKGFDSSTPLPLTHHIFNNHYRDAAIGMNRHQRRAMQLTHSYIDALNDRNREFTEKLIQLRDKARSDKKITATEAEGYGDSIKTLLRMVGQAKWHVRHYLEHPVFPELAPNTPTHKAYLKHTVSVDEEIKRIEESSRNIPLEKFNRIYDPADFDAIPDE